ncbi:MAG TPA: PSD1 and planctomycete cytochrome C domain-containing protein [Verrucomicrobiae bacterium]|nr:PSD1 and planctomycete cytochrome C domain-containing protein [Verrucomicrobiae bacterium]
MSVAFLLAFSSFGLAAEPSASDVQFFENKVRPILVDNCYKCHSHEAPKLKGGLSIEFRESLLKGGDTGPAIVPGDPEKSLLIKAIRYGDPDLQMPPKDKKLSDDQIQTLTTWVKMGAPYPANAALAKNAGASERDHWAFKPIRKYSIPEVKETNWVSTPIDNFIVATLEENGMKPSPMADKRTLIRRATFDLIGLAPTLKETEDFLKDDSTNAFAKVVDRLLASPQYGERWGRYWLDVARYSDTKGEVKQQQEDFRYPFAWTYRDYVIRAFNEDKPYNRFVLEQLAADKLPLSADRHELAAMGFLTVGDHFNGMQNDILNDRIDVVTKGFLGLTVTCARCHDHKFDPIPTKDYYSLRGIFVSCVEPKDEPILGKLEMTPQYNEFATKYNELNQQLTALMAMKRGGKNKEIRKKETELRRDIAMLELNHPGSPPRAMVLVDRPKPSDSPVFIRGEVDNQGPVAPRRFLEILSGPNRPAYRSGSGRLELAYDIIRPSNPLTARVMVNRIWLHHFGEGIVTTPDDFGNQSAPPSHPELLDYLALRFMDDGWSIKKMHRLIMLSSVYQQSSDNNPRYAQIDPNNRLLWRANIRRLEFEAVRDSLLAMGGRLDLTMGGHPVNLGATPYSTRRTVYGYIDRRNLPEVFNQFDFANPDIETGKRYETIVPQQALFMMNSPLVVEQARNLVNRPDFKSTTGAKERIKLLYDVIYQREPTDVEIQLGLNFLTETPPPETPTEPVRFDRAQRQKDKKGNGKKGLGTAMSLATIPPAGLMPVGAWAKYAHALLQANEAMFIN